MQEMIEKNACCLTENEMPFANVDMLETITQNNMPSNNVDKF